MTKPIPRYKSLRQLGLLATDDLKRLAESQHFRQGIRHLQQLIKRSAPRDEYDNALSAVCGQFSILDRDWVNQLARNWDIKRPLPIPNEPLEKRPEMSEWVKSLGSNGNQSGLSRRFIRSAGYRSTEPEFTGTETYSVPGSPKIWVRRSVLKDGDGARYLTLTVRLTPDLSKQVISQMAKDSLAWAGYTPEKATKPSVESMAFAALDSLGTRKFRSLNQHAQSLRDRLQQEGQLISFSTAKRYVRSWCQPKAPPSI